MNKSTIARLAFALFSLATVLVGCNEETVADPKIIEARDKQRQQMQPGTPGTPPAGTESGTK